MSRDELRAVILANPTEPPAAIAARIGMSVSAVGYARSYLIRIGQVAPLKPANRPITAAERETIIAMRRELRSFEEIRAHTGRGMGTLTDIVCAAIKAGELPPVKRVEARITAPEPTRRPAREVRLGLNMTDCERSAVASLRQSGHRGTDLELLSIYRGFVARKASVHAERMPA